MTGSSAYSSAGRKAHFAPYALGVKYDISDFVEGSIVGIDVVHV